MSVIVNQQRAVGVYNRLSLPTYSTDIGKLNYISQSTVPSLQLDFTQERLDPRITFARASAATRTNAQGLIETTPVNLLTYSQEFDNAAWASIAGARSVAANSVVAPDGTQTADTITADGTSAFHCVNQAITPSITPYVLSVFAKRGTNDFVQLRAFTALGGMYANFDLNLGVAGTVGTITGSSPTSSMQNIGNGWYRCSMVFTPTASTASGCGVFIVSSASAASGESNTLTTSVHLWGAQLETGSTASPYIPTTATASGAPRFDYDPVTLQPKGLLIEEQRTNLLTYSEQFDNAAWTKESCTISANAAVAPDGTTTADKLVSAAATATTRVSRASVGYNGQHAFSVFAKMAEARYVQAIWSGGLSAEYVNFDLQTGTVSGGTNGAGSIISVGNGWYRCTITSTLAASPATGTPFFGLIDSGSAARAASYTGNGTSGLYIWGAQLEAGSFPTSYIPSADSFTSRASSATFIGSNGLIQSAATNVARYNYNPLNLTLAPKLLLEEQRTNLLTYSEQFDNAAWTKRGTASVTANADIAPDGTTTADLISGIYSGSNGDIYRVVTTTASTSLSPSIYIKRVSTSGTLRLENASNRVNGQFNINLSLLSDGWERITASHPAVTVVAAFASDASGNTGFMLMNGNATSLSFYAWGAQLEAGSYPTSYIPTTSAQVTRSADVSSSAQATRAADVATMTGTNFSSWYNQSEGTFYVEADSISATINCGIVSSNDGTANNRLQLFGETNAAVSWYATSGGVNTMWSSGGNRTANVPFKVAGSYATNNAGISFNGASVVADTSVTIPTVNQLSIGSMYSGGYLNGHIKRIAYFQKRLSNTELQGITA